MRLWHYKLVEYLPPNQLVSQWRECVSIAKALHDNGTPNHILVNLVTDYPIDDFNVYCNIVLRAMTRRGYNVSSSSIAKLEEFTNFSVNVGDYLDKVDIFHGWHGDNYLKICMTNLYEKHYFAKGDSVVTSLEWSVLQDGYRKITGRRFGT